MRTTCDEWARSAVRYVHHTHSHTRVAGSARLTFAFLGSRTTVLPLLLVVARRATATFTTARGREPLKEFISLYISVCLIRFGCGDGGEGGAGVPSEGGSSATSWVL